MCMVHIPFNSQRQFKKHFCIMFYLLSEKISFFCTLSVNKSTFLTAGSSSRNTFGVNVFPALLWREGVQISCHEFLVSNYPLNSHNVQYCCSSIISKNFPALYVCYIHTLVGSQTNPPGWYIVRLRRAGQRTGPPSTSAWAVIWSGVVGKNSGT